MAAIFYQLCSLVLQQKSAAMLELSTFNSIIVKISDYT